MKVRPLDNERELLQLISTGDQDAFTIVFGYYSNLIYSFAVKLTRSEDLAEEITQEVFLKIWTSRIQLTYVENLGAYINRITRNHTYNVLKRISHETLIFMALSMEMTEEVNSIEEGINYKETNRILEEAIERLTPQQKLVYKLCHGEGLKYDQVATQLNISSATVHTHMKNALRNIRNHLMQIHNMLAFYVILHLLL